LAEANQRLGISQVAPGTATLLQTESNVTIDALDSDENLNNSTEEVHPDKLASFLESIHHLVSNDS